MSIIIKLQNLPMSASSLDVRRFFNGLSIYDGGVHIIGGKDGLAFIAFSNDEDARQAMAKNDSTIKGSKIKLFLSSRNEMKTVIDKARNQTVNLDGKQSTQATLNQQSSTQAQPSNGTATKFEQQQQQQTNGTSLNTINTLLGNRSKNDLNLNNLNPHKLTTNLSTITKTDSKVINSSQNQFDFNRNFNNDLSNLVTNLQEAPDYRRNRSSSPPLPSASIKPMKTALKQSTINDKSRETSVYSDQRVKKMLETVKNLDNLNSNQNLNVNQLLATNGGSVRSRLGGFDHSNDLFVNKTNGSNSGMPLLMTPNTTQQPSQLNGRFSSLNAFDSPANLSSLNNLNFDHTMLNHQTRYLLECRNLPLNIQIMDIQKFFRQNGILLDQDQIKLSIDDRGFFTGLAHLVITNEQDLNNVMSLNNNYLNGFPIQINPINLNPISNNKALLETPLSIPPSSNHDLMGQLNFLSPHDNPNLIEHNDAYFRKKNRPVYPLFMKGIPYASCNQDEVARFFEPIRCAEIVITIDRSGRPSGNAYVIFEEKEELEIAMRRNSKYMGRRYIELFPVDIEEVEDYKMRALNGIVGDGDSPYARKRKRSLDLEEADNEHQIFCAQVLGLPPAVNNKDLTNYFLEKTSQAIKITAVHIMLKQDKTNAGECFVEFFNKESLMMALKQDGQKMGNYRLSVKQISYEKLCRIVGLNQRNSRAPDYERRSKLNRREHSTSLNRRLIVYCRVSLKATVDNICDFFKEYKIRPSQVEFKLDEQGQKGGEVTIRFNTTRDAESAIRKYNNKYFIDKCIYLRFA